MMTRRSNRERAPSRKVMESQKPNQAQPSKAHSSKSNPKPPAQSPQPKAPTPKPSSKPSPVAQVQQESQVMESQEPTHVQPSVNAPDKPDVKDFGKKDDAVAKVPGQSALPKAHCQKPTAQSPAKSPQSKAPSSKPSLKPGSVAQVQQESQVQKETLDQSAHFSKRNTTNECYEVPTTHYALTLYVMFIV